MSPIKPLRILLFLLIIFTAACRNSATDAPADAAIVGELDNTAVKLEISQDALYRLTLSDLSQAGVSISALSIDNLSLSSGGTAVPILIQEDALIFYGQAPTSRYTAVRPYILRVSQPGAAMTETAVPPANAAPLTNAPQTRHLEEDNIYLAETYRPGKPDVWYWAELGINDQVALSFDLPTLDAAAPATLRINLWGTTSSFEIANDHDFDLVINDQLIETLIWDGAIENIIEINLPPGTLRPGQNQILLDNTPPGAAIVDIMQVNWLELEYQAPPTAVNDLLRLPPINQTVALDGFSGDPLLLNIADPAQPQRLTGQTDALALTADIELLAVGPDGFRSPQAIRPMRQSDWRNSANAADLLIVTTDALAPALEPLVAARQRQGLTAVVIPIAEIYDEFGFGEASPDSLRAFYQYAIANWQTPPAYTLLVGDATTDYRGYLDGAPQNIIPPYMIPVQFGGETVSDSRLVDVDEDGRPDLAIGRWPVDTTADVEALIERTLAYEQGVASPDSIFATDASEAQFADTANRLQEASALPGETNELLDGPSAVEVADRINQGAWLATYIGHGSIQQLGKDDVFSSDYVDRLDSDQPPIIVQLTCLSGLFAHQAITSLSEQMLVQEGGPVLIIGATSLTLPNDQEPFALNLFQNLQDPAITRIGDAFTQAKRAMPVDIAPGLQEISDTFVLFGDPSALIVRPTP